MGVNLKRARGSARLSVRGAASVRDVTEVRQLLLSVADENRRIVLDLSEARSCDAAFAQLLVSAEMSFAARSLTFEVLDPEAFVRQAFPATVSDVTWIRA